MATNASSMLLGFIRAQAITVVPPTSTTARRKSPGRLLHGLVGDGSGFPAEGDTAVKVAGWQATRRPGGAR